MLLKVSSITGPTLCRRGIYVGQQCTYLNIHGCGQLCTGCMRPRNDPDTLFITEVAERLESVASPILIVGGGEPLAQGKLIGAVLHKVRHKYKTIVVETNGAYVPQFDPLIVDNWVVQLKWLGEQFLAKKTIDLYRGSPRPIFAVDITKDIDVQRVLALYLAPWRVYVSNYGVSTETDEFILDVVKTTHWNIMVNKQWRKAT
jgi:organic radical activating enzyme